MTPQEENELLLRVVTKLAPTLLEASSFIPFGATLGSNRNVQLLKPESMKQHVTQDELDAYWTRELRDQVERAQGEIRTVCHCAAVFVDREDGESEPGVLIFLEHADLGAQHVLYPYSTDGCSKVILGEPTSVERERRVFVAAQ